MLDTHNFTKCCALQGGIGISTPCGYRWKGPGCPHRICEDRVLDEPASGEKGFEGGTINYCNPQNPCSPPTSPSAARVNLGSSLDTFRGRWTLHSYWNPRSTRTEVRILARPQRLDRRSGPLRQDSRLGYTGTSLIRNSIITGPCLRPMPRALRWS